ncbi:hypothetical protein GE09DRAFT_1281187 [Coniochaeta sp. 2T2.1]|nr:hypothetical protein GE09DRAFT_1281187 [Coniochaeta sp. 2T2.1]
MLGEARNLAYIAKGDLKPEIDKGDLLALIRFGWAVFKFNPADQGEHVSLIHLRLQVPFAIWARFLASPNILTIRSLLISPPLSYLLPVLSLTIYLALLVTRLPRLKSEGNDDPLFDDDWAMSAYLYPRLIDKALSCPPLTLLAMAVGNNIIFDPVKEELTVADVALASARSEDKMDINPAVAVAGGGRNLRILSVRTIGPPSRPTPPGVPNTTNTAYGAAAVTATQKQPEARTVETQSVEGVWKVPSSRRNIEQPLYYVARDLKGPNNRKDPTTLDPTSIFLNGGHGNPV